MRALRLEEFRPALVRYFSRRISSRAEVEDLVHDVFVRLVRRVGVEEMDNPRGYVFATANSVLVDWLRKREIDRVDKHEPFDPRRHDADAFPPERVLSGQEELARLTTALLELPETTRTIFILRQIEGMRFKDIAERLGLSVSAVEKNMQRALVHLTQRLND